MNKAKTELFDEVLAAIPEMGYDELSSVYSTFRELALALESRMDYLDTPAGQFEDSIREFIEVCKYNNRTPDENLALLIADNPDNDEQNEYETRVCNAVKLKLANC